MTCRYMVGILDKDTGKVRVHETEQYTFRPVCKGMICSNMFFYLTNTVEALYSGHPCDRQKMAAAENDRYRECIN